MGLGLICGSCSRLTLAFCLVEGRLMKLSDVRWHFLIDAYQLASLLLMQRVLYNDLLKDMQIAEALQDVF